ncbi:MAG: GDP-mannose 4,6-dehydratase [Oscillospiraceae bacterium]|nr:GDP-mannose 4,6-dehydratase [Oscillospiraceae bacterium]
MDLLQKTALVTGGAGLIGANLCRRLLAEGYRVICLDNFYTSYEASIVSLHGHPCFEFVLHDVTQPFDIPTDEIYHLAAPASPVHYQKDPIYTSKTIVFGTLNALECAKQYQAKLLLSSTSEIYGDPVEHPQRESYHGNVNPNGPRACYDESKRCAETLCSDYRRRYGTDTKVVRIFNTYGPYMDSRDGRVVSEFITKMLDDCHIVVHGNGKQTRSFCFVDDLVDGIRLMMESDEAGPINLGNPQEITVLQLAHEVAEQLGLQVSMQYGEAVVDEPSRRRPDITLAKTLLDWQPKISLCEGIGRTIEYFRQVD